MPEKIGVEGKRHMEDGATIRAEFHGNDIAVSSRDPLIGTLDLTSSTDTTVEVMLDRYSAEHCSR